eukprot:6458241-Amphidinium_carterae.2
MADSTSFPTNSSWATNTFGAWRRSARHGTFSIGQAASSEITSPAEEASALKTYWAGIFETVEPPLRDSPVSDFIIPLPWAEVELTPESIMSVILHSGNSTPGPDGVSYGHLRKLPHIAAQVVAALADQVMSGDERLPHGFDEAF